MILDRVDGIYAKQTAQALLLATSIVDLSQGRTSMDANFLTYWYLWRSDGELDDTVGGEVVHCNLDDLLAMSMQTQKFLIACCKDLLQMSWTPTFSKSIFKVWDDFDAWMSGSNVEFLHRTVYEFLGSGQVHSLFAKHSPRIISQPRLSDTLNLIRLRTILTDTSQGSWCFCSYFHNQAVRICVTSASEQSMIEELDRLGHFWVRRDCHSQCRYYQGRPKATTIVCATLVSQGAYETLTAALENQMWMPYFYVPPATKGILLAAVLGLEYKIVANSTSTYAPEFPLEQVDHAVLAKILERGASPNDRSIRGGISISAWQQFLQKWLLMHFTGSQESGRTLSSGHGTADSF